MMPFAEVASGILRLPARPRSIARSHAYAFQAGGRHLLLEPAHVGKEEQAFFAAWIREHDAAIVATHHHVDHVHGIAELQAETECGSSTA
jgi:glyoxylase-like metal-dependent hydrolase (beta-lactamase superfamily II)